MFDDFQKIVSRPVDANRSLAFLSGYPAIARFMDEKHGLHSYGPVMLELSKYSYPLLSIHRDKGPAVFMSYVRGLNKLGFNRTIHYYIYVFFLLIFGRKICDWGIIKIKKIMGKTPKL